MSRKELKNNLFRHLVAGNLAEVDLLQSQIPEAPNWRTTFMNMNENVDLTLTPLAGRRLNDFCIGSDPEFAFRVADGRKLDAVGAGLYVGLAAGADQNERLVELRPWPSRSVVAHVAGILTALRWLYRVSAVSRDLQWYSGAFFANDGIGGHVHFGRKSAFQEKEIAALNSLALCLATTGIFPLGEWNQRIQGDQRGQIYGRFGDTRIQRHGYEYRTLPSWLGSPAMAFTVLTASKLAVLDPDLVIPWTQCFRRGHANLQLLAKYYMGRDDDAAIMYKLLQRGMPQHVAGDFQGAWGIVAPRLRQMVTGILPASIKPYDSEVTEVFEHLWDGTPLEFREMPANFKDTIPDGYLWMPHRVRPQRISGVGDVIHNLVYHAAHPVEFLWDVGKGVGIVVDERWKSRWSEDEVLRFRKFGGTFYNDWAQTGIGVPRSWRNVPKITQLRQLILSGLFPLWTVETVQENSWAQWHDAHVARKTAKVKTKKGTGKAL